MYECIYLILSLSLSHTHLSLIYELKEEGKKVIHVEGDKVMKQQVMATGAQAMADGAGGAGGAGRAEFPGEPRVLTAEERARDRRLAEAKAERQRRRDERERLRVDVLLRAAEVLALLLFAGGMLFVVFFFPVLAHRTYFSENALLVNAAAPSYSAGDALIAQKMLERLQECHAPALLAPGGKKFASNEAVGMIMAAARDVGLQVETHAFDMHVSPHTLHRKFGRRGRYDTRPDYIRGTSVVALLRAPRGEGKEAVVLTAEYTDEDGEEHHVLEGEGSVAMLVSLMATLARVPWLSKDVIFLATPKSARRHEAVTSWLRDYHAYHMPMIRSGEIWAALALKLPDSGTFDTIGVAFEGEQGQYPNLDLVNVATSVIRGAGMLPVIPIDHYPLMREKHTRKVELRRARAHAEKLREARERAAHLPHGEVGSAEAEEPREFPPILSERGPKFLQLSTIWEQARTLFYDAEAYLLPKMVPSPNILQQVHTLRRSVVSQALGYSSGNHAAFKAFRVEAISLIAAPERVLALKTRTSGTEGNPGWSSHDIVRYGRTVEQMIHSCSNLLERFHQSFFLWVLIDEGHFLPPEKYLAPAGVLLLPLLVRAVVMWYAGMYPPPHMTCMHPPPHMTCYLCLCALWSRGMQKRRGKSGAWQSCRWFCWRM